jgi:hypothetical protein
MLQTLSPSLTRHPRRQTAYTTVSMLLVYVCLFWIFADNVSANIFTDHIKSKKDVGVVRSVTSVLYRRALPPSAGSVPNVPQAPLERDLPEEALLDTIAEFDAIFNNNEMMPPPLPIQSSETVELAANGPLDTGTITKHDKLSPAPLPHSHSKNVEEAAGGLIDDLDLESDADTLILKGMLSAMLTF